MLTITHLSGAYFKNDKLEYDVSMVSCMIGSSTLLGEYVHMESGFTHILLYMISYAQQFGSAVLCNEDLRIMLNTVWILM